MYPPPLTRSCPLLTAAEGLPRSFHSVQPAKAWEKSPLVTRLLDGAEPTLTVVLAVAFPPLPSPTVSVAVKDPLVP